MPRYAPPLPGVDYSGRQGLEDARYMGEMIAAAIAKRQENKREDARREKADALAQEQLKLQQQQEARLQESQNEAKKLQEVNLGVALANVFTGPDGEFINDPTEVESIKRDIESGKPTGEFLRYSEEESVMNRYSVAPLGSAKLASLAKELNTTPERVAQVAGELRELELQQAGANLRSTATGTAATQLGIDITEEQRADKNTLLGQSVAMANVEIDAARLKLGEERQLTPIRIEAAKAQMALGTLDGMRKAWNELGINPADTLRMMQKGKFDQSTGSLRILPGTELEIQLEGFRNVMDQVAPELVSSEVDDTFKQMFIDNPREAGRLNNERIASYIAYMGKQGGRQVGGEKPQNYSIANERYDKLTAATEDKTKIFAPVALINGKNPRVLNKKTSSGDEDFDYTWKNETLPKMIMASDPETAMRIMEAALGTKLNKIQVSEYITNPKDEDFGKWRPLTITRDEYRDHIANAQRLWASASGQLAVMFDTSQTAFLEQKKFDPLMQMWFEEEGRKRLQGFGAGTSPVNGYNEATGPDILNGVLGEGWQNYQTPEFYNSDEEP